MYFFMVSVYHTTTQNANVYSENLFDFSLDKQMFVYYDTDIQTAVRNKCSHVMEGVYEKQKKNGGNPVFRARDIGLEYETDYWG